MSIGVEGARGAEHELLGTFGKRVTEEFDLSLGIVAVLVEPVEPDPGTADGLDLDAAVGGDFGLGELEQAADPEPGLHRCPDLVPVTDRNRAEEPLRGIVLVEQVFHHLQVAVLEDPEWDDLSRHDHRVEGEDRDRRAHVRQPTGRVSRSAERPGASRGRMSPCIA
nr:hypothetical protein [Nocardioides alcanivorans]